MCRQSADGKFCHTAVLDATQNEPRQCTLTLQVSLTFFNCTLSPNPIHFIAIYGHMTFKAPYVMLLMQANPLRRQVGGAWALEIETSFVPVKWHRAVRRLPVGAQKVVLASLVAISGPEKVSIFRAHPFQWPL